MAADLFGDWRILRLSDLQFWHRDDARLLLVSLALAAGLVLVARFAMPRRRGRYTVAVPAVLSSISRPAAAHFTHLPLVVALADPYTSLVRSEATYPGRRICLMIDASNSMSSPFKAERLAQRGESESTAFVTTVAAAERFVQ